jgi:uncharacterized membrane protein
MAMNPADTPVGQDRSGKPISMNARFAVQTGGEKIAISILTLLVMAYIVYFSAYQIHRQNAFETNLDTLSVEQPLWNTLHGQFMRTTYYPITGAPVTNFNDRKTDTLFGDHVQPGLLILLLPYAILPRTETLMVILSICVGLGAIPMYRIAKRRLASPWLAMLFACGYLLLPALETNTGWDIHGANFLPPLLLTALDAAETGHIKLWWGAALLAMFLREDFPIFIGWAMVWMAPGKLRKQAWAMFGIGLAFSLASFLLVIPYFGGGGTPYLVRFFPRGTSLTVQGVWSVVSQASFWKNNLIKLMVYNARLGFPLLFLYFASGPTLLAVFPMILANGLSWYTYNLSPEVFHYSAPLIPWVMVGAVDGFKAVASLLRQRRPQLNWVGVLGVALGTSILTAHFMSGYTPLSRAFVWPEQSDRQSIAEKMISLVPADAPVSVELHLAGHFSRYKTVRIFPDVRDAQWIMLDVWNGNFSLYLNPEDTQHLWDGIRFDPTWETVSAQDGLILLKKGIGPPEKISDTYRVTGGVKPEMKVQFGEKKEADLVAISRSYPSRSEVVLCTDWDLTQAGAEGYPRLQFRSDENILTDAPGSRFRLSPGAVDRPGNYRFCSRQDADALAGQRALVLSLETKDPNVAQAAIVEAGKWAPYLKVIDGQLLEIDLAGLR